MECNLYILNNAFSLISVVSTECSSRDVTWSQLAMSNWEYGMCCDAIVSYDLLVVVVSIIFVQKEVITLLDAKSEQNSRVFSRWQAHSGITVVWFALWMTQMSTSMEMFAAQRSTAIMLICIIIRMFIFFRFNDFWDNYNEVKKVYAVWKRNHGIFYLSR